jgi:hypothetical protein
MAAWILWAANLLLAVNQIHIRIRAARAANRRQKLSVGRWFLFGQVLLMALLGVACMGQLTGWQTAATFIPVLFRGFAWFASAPQPFAAQELGKSELMYAAALCPSRRGTEFCDRWRARRSLTSVSREVLILAARECATVGIFVGMLLQDW